MDNYNNNNSAGTAQSVQAKMPSSDCDRQITMGFVDFMGDNSVARSAGSDPTMKQGQAGVTEIANFLSRPIRIADYSLQPGSTLFETLNPWDLWSQNASIKRKLDNYYNFKGNMKLTFKINGTPFHYGRYMASWRPLVNFSSLSDIAPSTNASLEFLEAITSRSQRLNVHLDPATDVGGCLCLPWFWHKNFIRVPERTDWQDMGELTLESLVDLRMANGGLVGHITITVFAHVEDVVLCSPTFELAAQAPGDEEDEGAKTGIISKPATAVAQAAGMLSGVPFIGPFASAASIGAGAVADIARIFGYSKPAGIARTMDMRPLPGGEFAFSTGVDTTNKLTFDPKQATTVDPRTTGIGPEDEMTVLSIAQRESFLTYAEWSEANIADAALARIGVTPALGNSSLVFTSRRFTPTALAFASLPFQFWSGTLIYRIEIIASQFHKGRLRITWDPVSSDNASNPNSFNTNFVHILDLEKTRNFEFPVQWGVDTPYRQIRFQGAEHNVENPVLGPGGYDEAPEDSVNGYVNISVLNRLTAPNPNTSVRVNIFVRAGEDFEVNGPSDYFIQQTSYFPPEDLQAQSAMPDDHKAVADVDPNSADIADDLVVSDTHPINHKALVFYGEPMVSFRSMLKRYNLWGCNVPYLGDLNNANFLYRIKWSASDFPAYYGYDPNGIFSANDQTGAGSVPFNPNLTTLLNYLTPAYVGWRGGMRSKYMPVGISTSVGNGNGSTVSVKVYRKPDGADISQNVSQVLTSAPANSMTQISFAHGQPLFQGGWTGVTSANGSIQVELPYYVPSRFKFAQNLNVQRDVHDDYSQLSKHELEAELFTKSAATGAKVSYMDFGYERWVSVADDFSLFYFQNAPSMYIYETQRPAINF